MSKHTILCVRVVDIAQRIDIHHDNILKWASQFPTRQFFERSRELNACWVKPRRNSFDGRMIGCRYFTLADWQSFTAYRKRRDRAVTLSSPLPVVKCAVDAQGRWCGELSEIADYAEKRSWWRRFWHSVGGGA